MTALSVARLALDGADGAGALVSPRARRLLARSRRGGPRSARAPSWARATSSAMPLVTGPHSTPSERDSSARMTASAIVPAVLACGVDRAHVGGAPAPVGSPHPVGDHQVGVQVGIARAGHLVDVDGADEAVGRRGRVTPVARHGARSSSGARGSRGRPRRPRRGRRAPPPRTASSPTAASTLTLLGAVKVRSKATLPPLRRGPPGGSPLAGSTAVEERPEVAVLGRARRGRGPRPRAPIHCRGPGRARRSSRRGRTRRARSTRAAWRRRMVSIAPTVGPARTAPHL